MRDCSDRYSVSAQASNMPYFPHFQGLRVRTAYSTGGGGGGGPSALVSVPYQGLRTGADIRESVRRNAWTVPHLSPCDAIAETVVPDVFCLYHCLADSDEKPMELIITKPSFVPCGANRRRAPSEIRYPKPKDRKHARFITRSKWSSKLEPDRSRLTETADRL